MRAQQTGLRRRAAIALAMVLASALAVIAPADPVAAEYDETALTNAWQIDGDVVYDIMRNGDVMYVGGNFNGPISPSGALFAQPNLVAFDALTGEYIPTFAPDINGIVETVEPNADGSMVYVGGHFDMVNGDTRYGVVALDPITGETIPEWTTTLRAGDIAYDIEVDGHDVYIGGQFVKVNNAFARRIARVDAVTGVLDEAWAPFPDAKVLDMALSPDGDRVYAVGRFLNLDGVFTNAVVAIDTTTGGVAAGWTNTEITQARGIDASADRVAIAYRKINWLGIHDTSGAQIRRLQGDGDFQDVEIVADRVFVGSHSFTLDGLPYAKLQAVSLADATVSTTFDTPAFGWPGVFAIYASGSHLWIGGDVHKIGTTATDRIGIVPQDPDQSGPTTPVGLNATYLPTNEITLQWTGSTDDTGILGYRVMKAGNQVAFVTAGTSWTDTSAQSGVNYVYAIEAVDIDYNVSDRSTPITISGVGGADVEAPTAPGEPTATSATDSTIELTWSASTDNVGVDYYEILRDGVVVGTSTTTSFSDAGLAVGAGHDYAVRAIDAAGNTSLDSPITTLSTATDGTAPTQPGAPTPTSITESAIELTWSPSTDNVGVVAYDVLRDGVVVGTSATPEFGDSGLTISTEYTYAVVARDAAGNESVLSDELVVTTTSDTESPSTPDAPVAAAVSTSTIELTWPASTDNVAVVLYEVLRDGVVVGTSTTPSFSDTGLSADTSYDYAIRAADAAGNQSPVSPSSTITTSQGADTVPPNSVDVTPSSGQEFADGVATFAGTATDDVGVGAMYVGIKNLTAGSPNEQMWLQSDLVSWGTGFRRLPLSLAAPGATTTTFTGDVELPEGDYGASFVAEDTSGNRDPSKPWRTFSVTSGVDVGPDVTRPAVSISSPSWNQSFGGPAVTFAGGATDNIGVVAVDLIVRDRNSGRYLRPDGTFGGYRVVGTDVVSPGDPSASWSATYDLPPGSYWVKVVSRDAAGNESIKPKRNFTVS